MENEGLVDDILKDSRTVQVPAMQIADVAWIVSLSQVHFTSSGLQVEFATADARHFC